MPLSAAVRRKQPVKELFASSAGGRRPSKPHLEERDHSIFLAVKGAVKPEQGEIDRGHVFIEID